MDGPPAWAGCLAAALLCAVVIVLGVVVVGTRPW